MGKKAALVSIKRTFLASLESGSKLVAAVVPYCARTDEGFAKNPLHPGQARRVVALAFLAITAAWEEFVGAAFVRYVAGATSPSGHHPRLLMGPPPSLAHAWRVVAGRADFDFGRRFLNWSPDDVSGRIKLFFASGSVFERSITSASQELSDAAIIRNRVAHASKKCRADFIAVSKRLLRKNKLSQGFSVGDLLLTAPPAGFAAGASLFESYAALFAQLAEEIAP